MKPTVISTVPTRGISLQASSDGIPTTPKYGTQAALVAIPNAPWPTNSAAHATRNMQHKGATEAVSTLVAGTAARDAWIHGHAIISPFLPAHVASRAMASAANFSPMVLDVVMSLGKWMPAQSRASPNSFACLIRASRSRGKKCARTSNGAVASADPLDTYEGWLGFGNSVVIDGSNMLGRAVQ